jgi:hypothetical protein
MSAVYNFTNTKKLGNITGYKKDAAGKVLAGWTITVKNATTFSQSNTTDANGKFTFNNLPWDTYYLNETPQCGWIQNTPNTTVKINCTNLSAVYNFTNTKKLGNITGIKFNDLNGNGVRDVNEPVLSGWVINLRYTNGTVYGTKTTGADGSFTFVNVPWGKYNLSETLISGWTQTRPAGNLYSIEINCTSLNVTGKDFGNLQDPNCCLCPTFAFFTATNSGRTVTFKDTSTGNPVQWSWSFGDGTTSQLRNPTITYKKSGTYTVTENVKGKKCDGGTYWVSYKKSVKV